MYCTIWRETLVAGKFGKFMVICQFAKVSPVKVFFHTVLNKTNDMLQSKMRKIMVMNCQFDNKLYNQYTNPLSFMPLTIDGGYIICLLKIHTEPLIIWHPFIYNKFIFLISANLSAAGC